MIKAVILDVDGILVGEKVGYNSPHPNPDVILALKQVRENGTPIILCTAKPHFSVTDIIEGANLHNPHITDAGAVIIDPIDDAVVKQSNIDSLLAKEVLQTLVKENVYVEFYTTDDYFIQEDKQSEITQKHNHILQYKPNLLTDVVQESENYLITKIMPVARDMQDKQRVSDVLISFVDKLSISWGVHPVALPLQFGIITEKGNSKKEAAEEAVKSIGLQMSDVLGVGDSTSDWSFIQLCEYGATLENGTEEIKSLIKEKGVGKYTIGKSVDENGILNVLKHFSLL